LVAAGGCAAALCVNSSSYEDAEGELYLCAFDQPDGRGGGLGRIYRLK
jgi:hypothetical protein